MGDFRTDDGLYLSSFSKIGPFFKPLDYYKNLLLSGDERIKNLWVLTDAHQNVNSNLTGLELDQNDFQD